MKTASQLVILVLATFNLSAATLYVSLESTTPVALYATWGTAATNIQDAVDVSKAGDTVLVTNGVYAVGSRDVSVWRAGWDPPQFESMGLNRVLITNSMKLESVNGPLLTTIDGGLLRNENGYPTNGVRCVSLGTNAVLSGFTLTNGNANGNGGGVDCEDGSGVVTNCILTGNRARRGGGAYEGTLYNCTLSGNLAGDGGGASGGTLYNCVLRDNEAFAGGAACVGFGGGAHSSTLYNCTLSFNRASYGGGAYEGTLYNCTLSGNLAGDGGGAFHSTLYNCTVTGNSAIPTEYGEGGYGGGALVGTLYNCIVYYNTAPDGANYFTGSSYSGEEISTVLNYCCTTPIPTNGVGNITSLPLFMDFVAGDFRLWEGSPCIDAATNLVGLVIVPIQILTTNGDWQTILVPCTYEPTDILGNTRFIDGNFDGKVAWDIGAYEFNSFPPPRFTCSPQLTAEGWKLSIKGAANKMLLLQRSSDLKNWEDVSLYPQANSFFMGADGVKQVTDRDPQAAMFYRAVVP